MTDFVLTTAAGDAVREKYRREGAAQERERIINLLFEWGTTLRRENNGRDDAIALELIVLIKGEK